MYNSDASRFGNASLEIFFALFKCKSLILGRKISQIHTRFVNAKPQFSCGNIPGFPFIQCTVYSVVLGPFLFPLIICNISLFHRRKMILLSLDFWDSEYNQTHFHFCFYNGMKITLEVKLEHSRKKLGQALHILFFSLPLLHLTFFFKTQQWIFLCNHRHHKLN